MGLFNKKKVTFQEPFTEKYRLEITSGIRTGNVVIDSKVEIRWEVKVKSVLENEIHMELLTLDNQLLEYNNPLIKTMSEMNQIFSKMYTELDLVLDGKYRLIKIKNRDMLELKWRRIKQALENMIGEEPKLLGEIINLNDANFEKANLLDNIVQNNEFFMIYFHHLYGSKTPSSSERIAKKNIFNTAIVEWEYWNTKQDEKPGEYDEYHIKGFITTKLNREWVKKHYAGFTHLNLNKTEPVMTEDGRYQIDVKTGKILRATLIRKEVADPQLLHGTTVYELQRESSPDEKENLGKPTCVMQPPAGYNPAYSVIIDD
jgi:hypothetical protein